MMSQNLDLDQVNLRFFTFLKANSRIVLHLSHDRFLSNPFQVIVGTGITAK
jgi:hypothetical protein